MKISTTSFSQVILHLFSLIFFVIGILLLIFTEMVSLTALNGVAGRLSIVIQQFLGNAYLLLAAILYLVRNFKEKPLHIVLTSLLTMGFINLYLIFQFNDLIFLPSIYFVFQVLLQLLVFFALIDEVRKN